MIITFFSFSSGAGAQLIEDVLSMGLSAKLMHFLRTRVYGDVASSQKDASLPLDTKHPRGRDENRGKVRSVQDSCILDGTKSRDGTPTDPSLEKELDRGVVMRQADGERLTDDTKAVNGEKHPACESLTNELLKRKLSRTGSRLGGKSKAGESLPDCERTPSLPTSGLRSESRATKDKNAAKVEDPKKAIDLNNSSAGLEAYTAISKEEYEDRFRDCIIGLKDITDIVLKAVRAAEAEARSANAPEEAVKAAGDAAAELVKSAASEVRKKTSLDFPK
jgi:HIV-1 Vpr-binding protein